MFFSIPIRDILKAIMNLLWKELNNVHIYYTILHWDDYDIYVAATDEGLCFICTGTEGKEALEQWQEKNFPERDLVEDEVIMEKYTTEIRDYLRGKTNNFTNAVHLCGTSFQKKVWNELCKVPYGEVRTYSDIAEKLDRPEAVRAVANAIGKNPLLFIVPCHRVIRKDGNLSGFRAGADVKKKLLRLEHILL